MDVLILQSVTAFIPGNTCTVNLILFYVICTAWCQWDFLVFLSMNDFLPGCLFAVVVIKCFMIGVNVWWVYLAPQNIPRAISVLTLGNKVKLYILLYYTLTTKRLVTWLPCLSLLSPPRGSFSDPTVLQSHNVSPTGISPAVLQSDNVSPTGISPAVLQSHVTVLLVSIPVCPIP